MKGQHEANLRVQTPSDKHSGKGSLYTLHGPTHCGKNTEGSRDVPALRDRPPPPQHLQRAVENTANSGAHLRAGHSGSLRIGGRKEAQKVPQRLCNLECLFFPS